MKKQGNFLQSLCYGLCLTVFTVYALLDAFVVLRNYAVTPGTTWGSSAPSSASTAWTAEDEDTENTVSVTATDTSYSDGKTSIELKQYRQDDIAIYVTGIALSDASVLKTALANNTYGRNITQTTSDMAAETDVVLVINEDYYSARSGYVIRNGVLYRDTSSDAPQEGLVIYRDSSLEIVTEGSVTATRLLEDGARQMLSSGPTLVKDGEVPVTQGEKMGKAMSSNPRTVISQIDDLHYVTVVTDGRTGESVGLLLYQMVEFIKNLGAETAYNLDDGGSITTVLNGKVINQPTTGGSRISEREVSDIVCIRQTENEQNGASVCCTHRILRHARIRLRIIQPRHVLTLYGMFVPVSATRWRRAVSTAVPAAVPKIAGDCIMLRLSFRAGGSHREQLLNRHV